jgi:hypothetical protein
MSKNNKPSKPSQPLIINRGRVVDAVYREPEIAAYEGNPLELALPPFLTPEQAIRRLKYRPLWEESYRNASDEIRYQLLNHGMRFFTPLDIHLDLYRRLSNLIHTSYLARNPLTDGLERKPQRRVKTFDQYESQFEPAQDQPPLTAAGFHLAGISGIGKSFSILRILNLFPQVIRHSSFHGREFTHTQLGWLKIDCPFDGNPRGLCTSFFKITDAILGTHYTSDFVKERRLESALLDDMKFVASTHCLGLLVVDELQRLSLSKSGGAERILNAMVHLMSEFGVPVLFVGTYKALRVLSCEFSYLRRGTSQGDLIWDRMENDDQWRVFVKSLFKLQYTRNSFSVDDLEELSDIDRKLGRAPKTLGDVLYEVTQGITDLAVKVFMFAQERAIDTKKERVTAEIIRSVARDKLQMLNEPLTALKSGDMRALEQWDDIYPTAFKDYLTSLPGHAQQQLEVTGNLESSPEIKAQLEAVKGTEANQSSSGRKKSNKKTESTKGETTVHARKGKTLNPTLSTENRRKNVPRRERGVLPGLVADLDKKNPLAGYKALKDAGYVRSASDFVVD